MRPLLFAGIWFVSSLGLSAELPSGEGKEFVQTVCTRCHVADLIVQNRFDQAGWQRILIRMQERNGMEKLTTEQSTKILDYLVRHLAPTKVESANNPFSHRPVNPLPK